MGKLRLARRGMPGSHSQSQNWPRTEIPYSGGSTYCPLHPYPAWPPCSRPRVLMASGCRGYEAEGTVLSPTLAGTWLSPLCPLALHFMTFCFYQLSLRSPGNGRC